MMQKTLLHYVCVAECTGVFHRTCIEKIKDVKKTGTTLLCCEDNTTSNTTNDLRHQNIGNYLLWIIIRQRIEKQTYWPTEKRNALILGVAMRNEEELNKIISELKLKIKKFKKIWNTYITEIRISSLSTQTHISYP